MSLLKIENLTKHFGGIVACNDLSFVVKKGDIMGIIGPNGAGKTTVFNLITGVYPLTGGKIIFEDGNIGGISPSEIVKKGIARTFQNIRLFKNLTVLQNVVIALDLNVSKYPIHKTLLRIPEITRAEKHVYTEAMKFLNIVGLESKATHRADSLPYGLQRKLEIARALALKPKLLLLDEPAAGMNPEESMELAALIRNIKNDNDLTILLIEHHMDVIMELCDRIVVMNFGEKLAEGNPEEIQTNPLVLKAYLGEGYKRA
jgi:ABC-type branched-subunit amino acid transport system ATPase component